MIAAVLQPYFFPYIGYFQLMHAVDVVVFYDDAQFVRGGWINRNLVERDGTARWITMPVANGPHDASINARRYALDSGRTVGHMKDQLDASYRKAPCRDQLRDTIVPLLEYEDPNVAGFNANLLRELSAQLGLGCRFLQASDIDLPRSLRAQEHVIALCQAVGATRYVNPIGGMALYDAASFAAAGIDLSFLETTADPAIPSTGQHLSIIHEVACRGLDGCRANLGRFRIIRP